MELLTINNKFEFFVILWYLEAGLGRCNHAQTEKAVVYSFIQSMLVKNKLLCLLVLL